MLDSFIQRCARAGFTVIDNDDWRDLHDRLTCGDIRYLDYSGAIVLDVFMKNEGVIREESAITVPLPRPNRRKGYYGVGDVQVMEKAILTKILKSKGFTIEGYELPWRGGEADLIAQNKEGLRVIGEVGACRVTKVYETSLTPPYAETLENNELWHLPYPTFVGEGKRKLAQCRLFVYKRGRNWHRLQREYQGAKFERFGRVTKYERDGRKES